MSEMLKSAENHKDWLEAIDLWNLVFRDTPRDYFERHLFFDPYVEYEHTRLLRVGDTLVSSVQITPRRMYVNGREVPFGGIANVSTHPDFQKRGYSSRVLKDAIRKMKEWSLPLSLLFTDINAFYERVGFVTLERETFVAEIQGKPRSDISVRIFDKHRDLEEVKKIYQIFSSRWNGPMIRENVYWENQFFINNEDPNLFLVKTDASGKIQAYVRASLGTDVAEIREFGASNEEKNALDALGQEVCIRGNRRKLKVTAPFGAWFETMPYFKVERKPHTGSMVSILSPEFFGFSEESQQFMIRKLFPREKTCYWTTDSF